MGVGTGNRKIALVQAELYKPCKYLTKGLGGVDLRSQNKDTIIVKSAQAVGWKDKYTHWWATNGEYYQRSLSYIGAFPLMYGGGHNTFVG